MSDKPYSIASSEAAFLKARQVLPGGVSSPVRAFKAVGGTPVFVREAEGCKVWDLDGNEYIDYVASYGPLIGGHAHEQVVAALSKAIGRGTSYGMPTEAETQLATMIIGALPGMEMLRFVNSGTEATMSALRLARAATGRTKVVKCTGSYHGHVDALLVQAGSGVMTLADRSQPAGGVVPATPGVPEAITSDTLLVPYNDLEAAKALFAQHGSEIACFCVEPVAGNMGVVPPAEGYLQGLRDLCTEHGALLLFDEVMTGFRVAWGGAQVRYKVRPDITCLGKIIGGGLPVGAYCGSKKLMEQVSPAGPVYQAGTLSGNPLAMAAGIATLELLKEPDAYDKLEKISSDLTEGLLDAAGEAGVPITINRVGSMLTVFFTAEAGAPVTNYEQAAACNTEAYGKFFHAMLENGVSLPPSQFEAWFPSLVHTEEAIEETLKAARKAFDAVKA